MVYDKKGVGRTWFQKIGEWEENISTNSVFFWEVVRKEKLCKRTREGFFRERVKSGRENCILKKT